jgi:hypothetical protein
MKKGSGAYPNEGDYVAIDYNAFLNNGTLFDTTIGKGKKALSFRYGKKVNYLDSEYISIPQVPAHTSYRFVLVILRYTHTCILHMKNDRVAILDFIPQNHAEIGGEDLEEFNPDFFSVSSSQFSAKF